jgi:hypothetical protein
VQRLETEKHDLIFDGQQRLEQGLAVQDELDALRSKLDKVGYSLPGDPSDCSGVVKAALPTSFRTNSWWFICIVTRCGHCWW